MIYTLYDHKTNRSYEVSTFFAVNLDIVWASQSNWFSKGSKVTIADENGKSKIFKK